MSKKDFSIFTAVGTVISIIYSEASNLYAFKLQINSQKYLNFNSEDDLEDFDVTTTINVLTKLRKFSSVKEGAKIAVQGTLNSKPDGELFVTLEDFYVIG